MSTIKRAEERIYEAVIRGELKITPNGEIWRIGKRGADRWNGGVRTNQCRATRAEKLLPTGYLMIRAMVNGTRWNGLAHRLVWFHQNGQIPMGLVINHKNGIKTDNRPDNLEVVTRSENARHATQILKVGRAANQWGMANHAAKLSSAEVEEIKRRRAAGEKLASVAKDFNVVMQTISRIARGDRRISG